MCDQGVVGLNDSNCLECNNCHDRFQIDKEVQPHTGRTFFGYDNVGRELVSFRKLRRKGQGRFPLDSAIKLLRKKIGAHMRSISKK
jgi:hypothetical protein